MRTGTMPNPDSAAMAAFHRAVAEHSDALKTFATRMLGDSLAAEDVAQDAFLALYRHLEQVPASAFRPWLFRVARNLCLDQLRRRKFKLRLFRDVERDDDNPLTPVDHRVDRPDEIAEMRESEAQIEAAIAQIPQRFREVFLLCEIQGLSYEDASAILGCPVKTISTRLFRARQRFREALGDEVKV